MENQEEPQTEVQNAEQTTQQDTQNIVQNPDPAIETTAQNNSSAQQQNQSNSKPNQDNQKKPQQNDHDDEDKDKEDHQVQNVEEQIVLIPDDKFYDDDHKEVEVEDSPLSKNLVEFHECFGFDSLKKYNINLLDDQTLIYSVGVTYNIFNIQTKEIQVLFCRDGGGIGSIAVHPSKNYFAVAEKGTYPNIYIYEYPSLRLYRILRKGTERSYSSINFSASGTQLASVGSYPDYIISLWDWKQEIVVLKAKAFAQEVFNVNFSQYSDFILTTSGLGHVKFWKVAETFTGLKLKGEIAKFGQVELSDVIAHYIFQDGKVLTSTEYGKLLLWEGNLIKVVISQDKELGLDCHQSGINVIFKKEGDIVTAGEDGYIKFWEMAKIENAEGDDFGVLYIKPNAEIKLFSDEEGTTPCNILHIVTCKSYWLIQDARGKIIKLEISANKQDYTAENILVSNSGAFTDLAVPDQLNCAVSTGEDGVVRLWDYVNRREYYSRKFKAKGTCIEWLPYSMKNKSRVLITGFSNGIVRYLLLNQTGFHLIKALKVHDKGIQFIRTTADGSQVAVVSKDGQIFFLEHHPTDLQNLDPFCLFDTKLKINDIQWDKNGEKVLLACQDGKVYEIKIPKKSECDNSQTYLKDWTPLHVFTIRMMEFQKPKAEEMDLTYLLKHKNEERKEIEEWEPAPIMNATYYDSSCSKVLISVEGKYLGYLYVVDWNQPKPIEAIPAPKINTNFLKFDNFSEWLVIGFVNGMWQLRNKIDLRVWLQINTHDKNYGLVRRAILNHEKSCVLSASDDGSIFVYKLDEQGLIKSAKGETPSNFIFQDLGTGITEGIFAEPIDLQEMQEEDIFDDSIYSIQQAKLLAEEDYKRKEANKKKQKILVQIKELVGRFDAIKAKNNDIDELTRLNWEEMTVDQEYIKMLRKRVEEDMEETRMEVKWDAEYYRLKLAKFQEYVKNELEVDTFQVVALRNTKIRVSTFKVKKLGSYMKQNLEEIYKLIDEEKKNQEQQQAKGIGGTTAMGDNLQKMDATTKQKEQLADKAAEEKKQEEEGGEKLTGAKAERMKYKLEEARIKAQLEELEKTKPTKESFEPESIRLINEALANLGDYKLKSSSTYDVPENQRMNVSKKRKHMFLLEEFIYNTKMKFNSELISLRDRKKKLIEKIKNYNEKVLEINKQLGITEDLFTPTFDEATENPDSFFEITEQDIDEFAKLKEDELAKGTKKGGGMGGMGGGGGEKKDDKNPKVQETKEKTSKKEKKVVEFKLRKGMKVQQSELEEEMKHIKYMKLNAEKQRMMDEINEEIELFDKDIISCQNEKNIMDSDMIIAHMKLITYYQELLVLVDMEDQDNKLISNLLNCKQERTKLQEEGDKITSELTQCVNTDASNEKDLTEQIKLFKEYVFPEDDHKREKIKAHFLRKFKKDKAKKLKLKNAEDEGEDIEDEEAESEEEDDEDFLDEDEDEKLDTSPVDNDPKVKDIMDKICELEDAQESNRKKKMDLERAKTQIGQRIEKLMKELRRAEDDLKEYQRKKLQRVNQLDVSFVMKIDQIQHNNSKGETQFQLPENLEKSVLFTQTEFNRLCRRIKELEQEQKKILKDKGKLRYQEMKLSKKIAEQNAIFEELNKKYEEKHILKFGDLIDLKVLDALQPTKQVLETREKFKEEERQAILRVEKAKQSLMVKKQELLEAKRKNTQIIERITDLGKMQMTLNKKLDSTNKQLFKEENEDKKNKNDLDRERQNLKDLVKFLSKEIEDLKTEIGLFKRKGGHIYTMVTSNKKNFN